MSKKILVTEDNDQSRYLSVFLLGKHGYEVITARNGFEAIRASPGERPDLILMDIHMPEMDGYEAIQRIKVSARDRPNSHRRRQLLRHGGRSR